MLLNRHIAEGTRKGRKMKKRIIAFLILAAAAVTSAVSLAVSFPSIEIETEAEEPAYKAEVQKKKEADVVQTYIPIIYQTEGVEEFMRPDLVPYIKEVCDSYGVKAELVEAMIERESKGIADCSYEGCYGLMQVYKKWHTDRMERLGVSDLYDEKGNILVGVDILMEYQELYGDDLYLVLGMYNGQDDCAEGVSNEYAEWIINRAYDLEQLHDSQ